METVLFLVQYLNKVNINNKQNSKWEISLESVMVKTNSIKKNSELPSLSTKVSLVTRMPILDSAISFKMRIKQGLNFWSNKMSL